MPVSQLSFATPKPPSHAAGQSAANSIYSTTSDYRKEIESFRIWSKTTPRRRGRLTCRLGEPHRARRLVLFVGHAFLRLLRQLLDDRVAHFARRHSRFPIAADVGGPEPGGEDAGDCRIQAVGAA